MCLIERAKATNAALLLVWLFDLFAFPDKTASCYYPAVCDAVLRDYKLTMNATTIARGRWGRW